MYTYRDPRTGRLWTPQGLGLLDTAPSAGGIDFNPGDVSAGDWGEPSGDFPDQWGPPADDFPRSDRQRSQARTASPQPVYLPDSSRQQVYIPSATAYAPDPKRSAIDSSSLLLLGGLALLIVFAASKKG